MISGCKVRFTSRTTSFHCRSNRSLSFSRMTATILPRLPSVTEVQISLLQFSTAACHEGKNLTPTLFSGTPTLEKSAVVSIFCNIVVVQSLIEYLQARDAILGRSESRNLRSDPVGRPEPDTRRCGLAHRLIYRELLPKGWLWGFGISAYPSVPESWTSSVPARTLPPRGSILWERPGGSTRLASLPHAATR